MWQIPLLFFWLLPLTSWAAPVIPDRPGFSTGTATVPPGAVQVEAGIQSSYGSRSATADSYTMPLLNLRTGLTEKTELNLLWDGIQVSNGSQQDTADLLIGIKHRLQDNSDFNLSLLGYLSVQEGHIAPFLGLLWDRELSSTLGVFGTLQTVTTVEEGNRQTNFQPAIGLAFSHDAQWSSFVEIYTDIPLDSAQQASNVIDAGLAWLPQENIQVDINFGLAMDNYSQDFIGIGLAVRY